MATDGPTPLERFIRGIIPENPVYRQLLGMCPTLAVTANMKAAMTMSGAVLFVLFCANVITCLIRKLLKPHLRILVFTLTIATFVTIADRFLAAYVYAMSKELGPYVPLIIVNCIIICRCEVCASKQGLGAAAADAVGQSIGFALALASIATVREILGSGSWFGYSLFWMEDTPAESARWAIMGQPPGAFITLGILLGLAMWIGRAWSKRRKRAPA
ncbi:MAG TPA: electron transport complex subunit RsxE [Phycisphaerae bacterium]|nr:electron transport complex subunit RsxE [Phycisphaerae bacterium]HUT58839.1 electron transport complex subunit RsxE [Phycisphaerae bacterium]